MISHKDKKSERLIERIRNKTEIDNRIINELKKEDDLTIAELVIKTGLTRSNFSHYLKGLEKKGLIIKRRQEEIHGRPTFLRLNKNKIKEAEQYSAQHWKSFEEYNLKSIFAKKIFDEIQKRQPSDKQHQELINLLSRFGKEGFGAILIFLLYSDFIKIDYNLSLTDKGKKWLKKHKK